MTRLSLQPRLLTLVLVALHLFALQSRSDAAPPGQGTPAPSSQTSPPSAAPLVDPEALRRANTALVNAAAQLPPRATLAELMRRTLPRADAPASELLAEHRAVLVAVAFYVNGWPLAALVPEASTWPVATRRSITLTGRGDLAQHFMVSAAIAAAAGSPLADAAGLYKEIRDAQDGSGFSFADLAADRAGTLFGHRATISLDSAVRWRARLGGRLIDADVMPSTTDLPEGLRRTELDQRFGGVGGAGYKQLVAEIDRRIAELDIYRSP